MDQYKVITKGAPLEVWAVGFYGDTGKAKAESMISEGYWHRHITRRTRAKHL